MRFTIKAKLASAFGVVLLLFVIAGALSYMKMTDLIGSTDNVVAAAGRQQRAAELQRIVLLQIRAEKNAILAASDAETAHFADEIGGLRAEFFKKKDELYAIATEAGKKLIEKFTAAYTRMNAVQDQSLKLAKGDKAKAAEWSANEVRKVGGETLAAGDDYLAFLNKLMADRSEQSREDGARAQLVLLVLLVVSLMIAVAAAVWI